eukprot:gene15129-21185_t
MAPEEPKEDMAPMEPEEDMSPAPKEYMAPMEPEEDMSPEPEEYMAPMAPEEDMSPAPEEYMAPMAPKEDMAPKPVEAMAPVEPDYMGLGDAALEGMADDLADVMSEALGTGSNLTIGGSPTDVDPAAPLLEERMVTCTDVPPGMRHTCAQQKGFGKCEADFMIEYHYCDETCGRPPCDNETSMPVEVMVGDELLPGDGAIMVADPLMLNQSDVIDEPVLVVEPVMETGPLLGKAPPVVPETRPMLGTPPPIVPETDDLANVMTEALGPGSNLTIGGSPTDVDPNAPLLEERMVTCTDVPPGMRHTCAQQKGFGKCEADFMIEYHYCDETCGRPPCDNETLMPVLVVEPVMGTGPLLGKAPPVVPETGPMLGTPPPVVPETGPMLGTPPPVVPETGPMLGTPPPMVPETGPMLGTPPPVVPETGPMLGTPPPVVLETGPMVGMPLPVVPQPATTFIVGGVEEAPAVVRPQPQVAVSGGGARVTDGGPDIGVATGNGPMLLEPVPAVDDSLSMTPDVLVPDDNATAINITEVDSSVADSTTPTTPAGPVGSTEGPVFIPAAGGVSGGAAP